MKEIYDYVNGKYQPIECWIFISIIKQQEEKEKKRTNQRFFDEIIFVTISPIGFLNVACS